MIDAYEIGIQLLLQEDVSAGLAVITRELAEVDRAIAATSVDLAGLAHQAETATKAVAAAAGTRLPLATTPDHETSGSTEQVAQRPPGHAADPIPAVISGEKAAAPEMKLAEQPVPAARAAADTPRDAIILPQHNLSDPAIAVAPNSPIKSGREENLTSDQPADKLPVTPEQPAVFAQAQVAPTAPRSRESAPSTPVREVTRLAQDPRRSVTPSSMQAPLTASVGRAQQQKTAMTQPEQKKQKSIGELFTTRERPAAPWTGVDSLGPHDETTRSHERAAAPQTESKSRSESGGGTVMLDGRLVGQWLSEQMAREASRPPVGTSFFDPRQTPAWNVSGAL